MMAVAVIQQEESYLNGAIDVIMASFTANMHWVCDEISQWVAAAAVYQWSRANIGVVSQDYSRVSVLAVRQLMVHVGRASTGSTCKGPILRICTRMIHERPITCGDYADLGRDALITLQVLHIGHGCWSTNINGQRLKEMVVQ